MPKPVTPLVGCDMFVVNESKQVLLIQRSDNGFWALPGGCHDLGETPQACAEREFCEETGLTAKCTDLIGVYSSNCYKYVNYPWTDLQFCHVLFFGRVTGGQEELTNETTGIGWFAQDNIPPLTDGHDVRIRDGFNFLSDKKYRPYFE